MDTSEILKRIRRIEITTKNMVQEVFSGEYHSVFRGQGLEFAEVREYQMGDSYRDIDWNVSARMGHPYIKKFEETRELNVIFLVDCSASNVFGTRQYLKSEYIAEVTAVLSFSALSNQDKVGLLLFSDRIEKYVPPRKGKKATLQILRDILFFEPQGKGTDINQAVEYISHLVKKRSIFFIISDFYDQGFERSVQLLGKKHDVVALRVTDQAELELPKAGILHLEDPETGDTFTIDSDDEYLLKQYSKQSQIYEEHLQSRFKKMQVDLVNLKTDQSYVTELQKFFKTRIRKRVKS
ncbi:MAG TPA: DUF58 domain-containing protein [Candidatus Cloacimonadota bacterium]|nr:DUF58 domain-containing protein [Candidatus Cloacimonadota bacterium]HPT71511.1 DUF58 domain-containing protein [Candidatus Cloacimonadota bacterium]